MDYSPQDPANTIKKTEIQESRQSAQCWLSAPNYLRLVVGTWPSSHCGDSTLGPRLPGRLSTIMPRKEDSKGAYGGCTQSVRAWK